MPTLIVHPDSKEKLTIIKAFLKAMKISFVEEKPPYSLILWLKYARVMKTLKQGINGVSHNSFAILSSHNFV